MTPHDKSVQSLAATTKQVTKALSELSRSASRLSSQSTSTLCGVAGGFIGMSAAYGLSLAFPISLPIVAFLLAGVGVSGGVLTYRLNRGVDVEVRLDINRLAVDEVLDRIKKLPKDAPPEVRKQLWETYQALNYVPQLNTAPRTSSPALPPPEANAFPIPIDLRAKGKSHVDRDA
jgi:hypothetical protein